MDGTGTMKNCEVVVLELQDIAGKTTVRILYLLEPPQIGNISQHSEVSYIKEGAEV